jgi:hypothetical protein
MFFAAPVISGLVVKISLENALTLVRMCRSSFSSESMSLRIALIALFSQSQSIHSVHGVKRKTDRNRIGAFLVFFHSSSCSGVSPSGGWMLNRATSISNTSSTEENDLKVIMNVSLYLASVHTHPSALRHSPKVIGRGEGTHQTRHAS